MNVSVKQITEPVDRRTLILEKDVKEGDVIYTVRIRTCRFALFGFDLRLGTAGRCGPRSRLARNREILHTLFAIDRC
jgi:hypothetical protein